MKKEKNITEDIAQKSINSLTWAQKESLDQNVNLMSVSDLQNAVQNAKENGYPFFGQYGLKENHKQFIESGIFLNNLDNDIIVERIDDLSKIEKGKKEYSLILFRWPRDESYQTYIENQNNLKSKKIMKNKSKIKKISR